METRGTVKTKQRIRDLERILDKPGLSAIKKIELERALKANKDDLHQINRANRERKNASKYHMVRFFERKKAWRRLKQKGEEALADWYYVSRFPHGERYTSIFVKGAERSHPFYATVQEELASGKLPRDEETIKDIVARGA